MVFQDEIKAASPVQFDSGVDLVIVVAPAFIHHSIYVGERYLALVRLVRLELPVAEELGLQLPLLALT